MLTSDGAAIVALLLAEQLSGGSIRVGDGEQTATAAILDIDAEGDTVTVQATFPELEANFDWRFREVVTSDDVVIDRDDSDLGRKVLGAVWAVDVPITVAGA